MISKSMDFHYGRTGKHNPAIFFSFGVANRKSMKRDVHVFSDSVLCVGNDSVNANQAWATKLAEVCGADNIHGQVRNHGQTSAIPLAHIFRPHGDPNHERNSNIPGIHGGV